MILIFGSINTDLIARVRTIARPGETVLAESTETRFGGKGANQAVAAARARQDAGLRVAMAGAVGSDGAGKAALDNLAAQGVDVSLVARTALPTGWACIAVSDGGENAITVASGANAGVRAAQVPDELLGTDTVLVLQMEVPPGESLALARRARRRGARVILNLAPAPESPPGEVFGNLLENTDILVTNEHEVLVAARTLGASAGGEEGAARSLASRYRLATVVTLGPRGALAAMPDGPVLRAQALPVEPVDTTGAGDTFTGVLAAGLASGVPLAAALRRACVAGSLACLALGAQTAMPDPATLQAACDGA